MAVRNLLTAGASVQRQSTRLACTVTPPDQLSPRAWVKCVHAGHVQPDAADPLRFSATGIVATAETLVSWIRREGISSEIAIRHVTASHEFSGTAQARNDAKMALPMEKRPVCIRPVRIADDSGQNPTTLPSFEAARTIWAKCCLDVSVASSTTVKNSAFKTLDHDGASGTATAQQRRLFTAAGASGGCISVFAPETLRAGGKTSKDISGGGAAFSTPFGPAVVVVEGADPTIVAHELGHAMGYAPHAPPGTIMEVVASTHTQKESDRVAWPICEDVRQFVASAGGKDDCKVDVT